jgi:hypothetical protein
VVGAVLTPKAGPVEFQGCSLREYPTDNEFVEFIDPAWTLAKVYTRQELHRLHILWAMLEACEDEGCPCNAAGVAQGREYQRDNPYT